MKKECLRFLSIAVVAVSLSFMSAACSQKTVNSDSGMDSDTAAVEAVGSDASMDSGDKGMETAVLDPGLGPEESLESPADTVSDNGETFLEGRTSPEMLPVYFDFDDSGIRKDQVERIEKNATFLKNSKNVKIRIEGNCDERGTDEYNVALGERRAMSAKKYLENLGVAGYRMNTISFGEKRPINYGHDDLSWSQNRRDDFLIIK